MSSYDDAARVFSGENNKNYLDSGVCVRVGVVTIKITSWSSYAFSECEAWGAARWSTDGPFMSNRINLVWLSSMAGPCWAHTFARNLNLIHFRVNICSTCWCPLLFSCFRGWSAHEHISIYGRMYHERVLRLMTIWWMAEINFHKQEFITVQTEATPRSSDDARPNRLRCRRRFIHIRIGDENHIQN